MREAIDKYATYSVSRPNNVTTYLPGKVDGSGKDQIWISPNNFQVNREWGNGAHFKDKAYRFNFDVKVEYDVEVKAAWWTALFRGSIPGYWKGKFKVTYSFNVEVPSWNYGDKQVRPPQYSFKEQEKQLLFVPRHVQKIEAEGKHLEIINPFLKDQHLDFFEHYHPDLTQPLDMVSYLMYAIADKVK
ncbi:DUF237 domain-containing protein [Mycoplasmoides pneumoniae]|uniref:MG032/MG096/MG288 family 1 n=3 Tax=Mycoplasmoides pneumoniae TaxID=2104 RepID=A0AAV5N8K0_MYCPM|nr:DUF237 domain-containing protein [Mycoplasmoides pneumoniae]ADK86811.1 MG032/MG096/MG288 family 1 [Mycoplasmoides pneumoniae FH]ALA30885.1 hypothetical protein B434_01740 [Mycoplasmoides pneumoniae 19294]ALA31324.1 hypothetical protein F536_00220 [Mycoplasmoides pneumoniae 39443]ALA35555.1 hypothetical protein F539_00220 [Mycoplasmoides pneumoniae FH]ALA36260.1 hypothetical protein F538_00220 [Mycoplasmoides pneumoniae M1139]